MPLILDYQPTAALYRRCAAAGLTMARIGYSDQHHLLGIVDGAARFAREHGIAGLPLGVFSTVGHYIFQMLPRYLHAGHRLPAAGGDPAAYRQRLLRNARLATGFLATLTDAGDPDYGAVHVTHHYDHGHHTLPGGVRSQNELLRDLPFIDLFSSVMFDDTHSPFADNVASSIAYRSFVEDSGRRKVMEGCLVVPNIGTESVTTRQVGVQWRQGAGGERQLQPRSDRGVPGPHRLRAGGAQHRHRIGDRAPGGRAVAAKLRAGGAGRARRRPPAGGARLQLGAQAGSGRAAAPNTWYDVEVQLRGRNVSLTVDDPCHHQTLPYPPSGARLACSHRDPVKSV